MHDLDETPLEGSHDVFMHEKSSSLAFDNIALPNPLHTHVSHTCSQPSISPEYSLDAPIDNHKICYSNVDLGFVDNMFNMHGGNVGNSLFLEYFYGYDAFLDPYYIFLVDKPRKIMWNTFFGFSFDFSMALALLKRALTFFIVVIFMLSYCMLGNSMLRSLTSLCVP